MSSRMQRLIWREGMYLAPHHFQAQSRFFEDAIHFVAECFSPFQFGFFSLEIDEGELRSGVLHLAAASGIMPDGLVFELNAQALRREVADLFRATGQDLLLYLAVPAYREGQRNLVGRGDNENLDRVRYREVLHPMTDFNTGQDMKSISLLGHNLRIALQQEIGPEDVALPLVRLQRNGMGEFVVDPAWVPPCLQISACPQLQVRMERLQQILIEKSHGLADRRRGGMLGEVRHDPRELAEFWLLHAINSAIPLFRMWSASASSRPNPWRAARSPHPAELFRGLSELAGALCTFVPDSEPGTLPEYDHLSPGECFAALDEHIRRHVELGLPTNCVTIPLDHYQQLFFRGEIEDKRCFGPSKWVLGVRSSLPEAKLISLVPRVVKVSARDWIERVVRQQVPGAPLSYLPSPPPAVRPSLDAVYFSIDQKHRFFEPLKSEGTIGIYVPAEIPGAELELHIAVGGSQA